MIISLVLSFIAIASGTLLTYTYDENTSIASRLCSGACIGMALLGLVGLILASFLGLNDLSLAMTALPLSAPFLLLRKEDYRIALNDDFTRAVKAISGAIAKPDRWDATYFLFYALVVVVMWLAFSRACIVTADGLYTGVLNNFGDLPFHISAITRFAFGHNLPPEDPTFAGARFTYPFLTDFISAMFVSAGASLRDSMFIENWIVAIALVGVLHRFGQELLRNRTAALITPALILLNGGLGWAMIFSDVNKSEGGVFQVLRHISHSYTILPEVSEGWRWGNSVTSLLVPQRGFLLGIPIAVMVFTQWWISLRNNHKEVKKTKEKSKKEKSRAESSNEESTTAPIVSLAHLLLPRRRRMLAAGLIAGLLPLIHAHSFISVMLVGSGLALLNLPRWRDWLIFLVVASLVAGPQMLWSTHGSAVKTSSFIGWEFGWQHGDENVLWFWFKNTGLFIPLLVAAVIWKGKEYLISRKLLFFFLPFTLCFIIPNVVRLAPWVWDNIKVLFYWWIGSAPIVAYLLARLWEGKVWNRALAVILFMVLTLAGALDVFATVTQSAKYEIFDHSGMVFAEMIKEITPPQAMILHAAVHNTPVFLTGRRSLLGYIGHIWTHGIDYGPREIDLKKIYAGVPQAPDLLRKYGVDYVVIAPQERAAMSVNDAFFNQYPIVANSGEYRLYQITH